MICGIATANDRTVAGARCWPAIRRSSPRILNEAFRTPISSRPPRGFANGGSALITPAQRARVRRLRVPPASQRRAQAGTPGLPGRDRERPASGTQARSSTTTTSRSTALKPNRILIPAQLSRRSHCSAMPSAPSSCRATASSTVGRGTRSERWPSGHRFRSWSRVRPRGSYPADHPLSANTAPGALASADLVLLVGQYCMPTPGRVCLRSRREIHPNRPRCTGHRQKPANRSRDCQLRESGALKRLPPLCRRCVTTPGSQRVAAARVEFEAENERVLPDRARLHRCRAPGGYRQGARRLPACRRAAARPDDHRAGRLWDRRAIRVATCAHSDLAKS